MKKWFLFFAICVAGLVYATPIQDRRIDPVALSQLTTALGIPKEADIIAETQKQWLRRPGQERWELTELSPEQRCFVLNWAAEQGLFASWTPLYQTYDKALILGATTYRMQMRLDYLKKLWLQGVRFHEIVWLTGDRPLDPRADALTDRCKNESEASHILWNETDLPEEMRKLPVVFVAVPMKKEGTSLKRPNTEDTIIAWLGKTPGPCTALFVSDQPFCGYQFSVIKSCLPDFINFDLVGQGVSPDSHPAAAAITLDSIARWIYHESLKK